MKIVIENKEIRPQELESWRRKHALAVFRNLNLPYDASLATEELCADLTEKKLALSYEDIKNRLKWQLKLAEFGMKLAALFSGKRRKKAETTLYANGIDVATLGKWIDHAMLVNSEANHKLNISVCPEHYALVPRPEGLEVIEKTGNCPVPTQFFISFDEETGIQTPREAAYPYQSVGVAKLADGRIIGGVRHKFRDTADGIEAKTVVEFPALCPSYIVRDHQLHLAVEWSGWINWAIAQQGNDLDGLKI